MGKLIVHIGYPKTGTTALQKFFTENRQELLQSYKVLYPQAGSSEGESKVSSHFPIAFSLNIPPIFCGRRGFKLVSTIPYDEMVAFLIQEFRASEPDITVLSSEHFVFVPPKKFVESLRVLSSEFEEIEILVYLRRQDFFLESFYKQLIKDESVRLYDDIWVFFQHVSQYADYFRYISEIEERISSRNIRITPLIYDRKVLLCENIVSDFIGRVLRLNINAFKQHYHENSSISAMSALFLRELNVLDIPPEVHKRIVQILLSIDETTEDKRKYILTVDDRIKILEFYRRSNEALFKEYFGTENRFVLSCDEIELFREYERLALDKLQELEIGIIKRAKALFAYLAKMIHREERITPDLIDSLDHVLAELSYKASFSHM